ncbi:hypothetical protein [Cohnella faecalis]|uniref:hypothetical protein n=1 Tax=Cohnella faecalis TaxID=2315694 RepID=UPI002679EBA7|nr:hypothetical protein [Cohnella faecalis]
MNKQPGSVPFGYEPPADTEKGTLIYYDTFESSSEKEWTALPIMRSSAPFAGSSCT